MKLFKNNDIRNAIFLGFVCTISYLGCYFARNVLSVVSPQMSEHSIFTVEFIGLLSTGNMFAYAIGQLLNGRVGDLIKGKYLVGGGLVISGICNLLLPFLKIPILILVTYSLMGFFLSMIYAPIMRIVAENTLPIYASRCGLGFSFASLIGAPAASIVALFFNWEYVFIVCGVILILLGGACFVTFTVFEQKGIIQYKSTQRTKNKVDVKLLLERGILKFALIAVLSGIIRTSVMFWIPTYLSQYLGLTESDATVTFTIITLLCSLAPFLNMILIYDIILKRDMERMLRLVFTISTISFVAMFFVSNPVLNSIFLTLALFTSRGAANIVFTVYCPSLRDTGMVSTVTGFMDAISYLAAGLANLIFTNIIYTIGWNKLFWIWAGLMMIGVLISLPQKKA